MNISVNGTIKSGAKTMLLLLKKMPGKGWQNNKVNILEAGKESFWIYFSLSLNNCISN